MSEDQSHLNAVAETLERLQIEPKDLFGYVFWLRQRYATCVEALFDINEFSTDAQAAELAHDTLATVGAIENKEDVSRETN